MFNEVNEACVYHCVCIVPYETQVNVMNGRVCPYERRGRVIVHARLPVNGPRLSIAWGDLSLTGVYSEWLGPCVSIKT